MVYVRKAFQYIVSLSAYINIYWGIPELFFLVWKDSTKKNCNII